jgi:hypothetical protein
MAKFAPYCTRPSCIQLFLSAIPHACCASCDATLSDEEYNECAACGGKDNEKHHSSPEYDACPWCFRLPNPRIRGYC